MKTIYSILFIGFILSDSGSGYTGSTFRYGFSARLFSLAGSTVADKYNTYQSLINPASLTSKEGTHYGVSLFSMSLDRSIQSFYFSKALPGQAGLSISIIRTGVDNIIGKDLNNNYTRDLSSADYYGLLSFGLRSFGLTLKMHYSNLYVNEDQIDSYSGNAFSLDLGWARDVTDNLRLGFKCQNILSSNLRWDLEMPSIDNYSHSYIEEYPLIISGGLSTVLATAEGMHKLFYQQSVISLSDVDPLYEMRIGYEYFTLFDIVLRAGFKGRIGKLHIGDDLRCGFGYTFNLIESLPLVFDYSIDFGSESEGLSHLFTWSTHI